MLDYVGLEIEGIVIDVAEIRDWGKQKWNRQRDWGKD